MQIKICGIKNEENLRHLCKLDIAYTGFIFAPSKRQVDLNLATALAKISKEHGKKTVGVFVDESDEFITECVKKIGLDVVQIYKKISQSLYLKLKEFNTEVWQVFSLKDELVIDENCAYDLLLFDTKGDKKGGNGFSFDWSVLKNYDKDFVLAGGIGLDNIKEALKTGAKILDINSKVENEKMLKDCKLIEKILAEVKNV